MECRSGQGMQFHIKNEEHALQWEQPLAYGKKMPMWPERNGQELPISWSIWNEAWGDHKLESRRRRTKGSVVGEEWCQNAAPLRWYTKNLFAQSKMILSRAWLHDTVSCAAWNDARKGVYLKPLFKTPCSNCYWGWIPKGTWPPVALFGWLEGDGWINVAPNSWDRHRKGKNGWNFWGTPEATKKLSIFQGLQVPWVVMHWMTLTMKSRIWQLGKETMGWQRELRPLWDTVENVQLTQTQETPEWTPFVKIRGNPV